MRHLCSTLHRWLIHRIVVWPRGFNANNFCYTVNSVRIVTPPHEVLTVEGYLHKLHTKFRTFGISWCMLRKGAALPASLPSR